MGKIFYIMGKSASGKDHIYARLAAHEGLGLKKLVLYTTRPIRAEEELSLIHICLVLGVQKTDEENDIEKMDIQGVAEGDLANAVSLDGEMCIRDRYNKIRDTLDGEIVEGNGHGYFTKGKILIGTADPEVMKNYIEENDMVIPVSYTHLQTASQIV